MKISDLGTLPDNIYITMTRDELKVILAALEITYEESIGYDKDIRDVEELASNIRFYLKGGR